MALDYSLIYKLRHRAIPINFEEADYAFKIRNEVLYGNAITNDGIIRWTLSDEWILAYDENSELRDIGIVSCSGMIDDKTNP